MKITKLFDRLNAGEHASRALRITLEEELHALTARLVFLTPEGRRYVSDPLVFSEGEAEYPLPRALLDGPGVLLAQLVTYDGEEFVRKSAVQEYTVFPSVPLADGISVTTPAGTVPADAQGLSTPEEICECKESYTGKYLAKILKNHEKE